MPLDRIRREKPLIGTFVEISVDCDDKERALGAISEAFLKIEELESLLSVFCESSEISRINRLKAWESCSVSKYTNEVLTTALKIWQISEGLFDIVVPSRASRASSADIILAEESVTLRKPLYIDLGGIAKGFAVDLAFEFLKEFNFPYISVSAGGDLRIYSNREEILKVRNPLDLRASVVIGSGYEFACATSADYYRAEEPKDFGLYNPTTQKAISSNVSCSVIADSCMVADALTKVVAVGAHISEYQPIVERVLLFFGAVKVVIPAKRSQFITDSIHATN